MVIGVFDEGEADGNARARGQFQGVVSLPSLSLTLTAELTLVISVWDQLPFAPAPRNADRPGADRAADQL
jgi:hypothetical protein